MPDKAHDSNEWCEVELSARILTKSEKVPSGREERMQLVKVLIVRIDQSIFLDISHNNLSCCR